MSLIRTNRACGGRSIPDWRGGLAGLALLAFVSVSQGQVSVETIGGGVRTECGPSYGFAGGNTWTAAQFNLPYAAALDTQGDLWIADRNNADIEEVTQAGNRTSSLTIPFFSGTNHHPLPNVTAVALDSADCLYVLTTTYLFKFDDVADSFPDLNILFEIPLGAITSAPATAMAVVNDASTSIYISFTNNSGGTIIRIPQPYAGPQSGWYSTVVNNWSFAPAGLSMRVDGQLAVSDTLNDGIYVVATNNGSTPVLVTGGYGPGFVNGAAGFAMFNQPHGIAASADGRMVVCDTMNNYLRVIDTNYNTTTLYGTPTNVWTKTCCDCDPALYAGWVDGTAGITTTSASGREPVSVTISSNGTLFVTEAYYSLIRAVTGSGLTPVTSISSSTNPPTLTLETATNITGTGATLGVSVDPNGSSTTVYFQWGLTTNVSSTTLPVYITNNNNLNVINPESFALTGLQPNTIIYYQAVAYNSGGYTYGTLLFFRTPVIGPVPTTLAASNITSSSATLNGTVNPENVPASFYFEWGATTNYGNFTATNVLSGNLGSNQSVAASLANLGGGASNHFQLVAFNSAGTNFGGDLAFVTLAVPPVLTISPAYGYFPECQTITVTSSVSNVFYTEDGSAPSTNSLQVLMTNGGSTNFTGTFQWCNPQADLSALQIIAVSGTVESQVVTGTSSPTNQLGFVRSPFSGIGSWAFIPIVLDLQSNYVVESLSFRVEVTPIPPNTNMISSLTLLSVTSNDFVQMVGGAPGNIAVPFFTDPYTTVSNGQGLAVLTDGPGSGLEIQNYGVVGLLEFQIPTNASTNQSYSLNILYLSGTSGGYTNAVPMSPMAPQTLTVADLPYLVGDSTPHCGYDAEEFGDGILDDSDVNSVIYASMGIRVPPVNSDAYNAMDAWPQTPTRNGDGLLQYLDWYQIWQRSLDLETPNWIRFWTNGGVLFGVTTTNGLLGGAPAVPTEAAMSLALDDGSPPGLVWFCHASIAAGTVTNLSPGNTCSLPVHANVLAGCSLAGLQFRAVVSPNGNAPPVGQVLFKPAANIPSPLSLPGLSSNDILNYWILGHFTTPLQNNNYIGTISFQVPTNAQAGQSYAVHFIGVNGVPDDTTEYTMESFPGYAWVGSAALQPASITSDEWKLHFFGSLTNSLAGDDVDADGDGVPNWQEYLAGTDPTNPLSVFQFGGAGFSNNGVSGVALSWLTAPGKTYILETIPALGGKSWTAINTNTGDGYTYQFIQTTYNDNAQFYRILLQP
jgi:hypothetical protein